MSNINLPSRQMAQPSGMADIDLSNPLTRGLVNAYNMHQLGFDSVEKRLPTLNTAVTEVATQKGMAARFNGSNSVLVGQNKSVGLNLAGDCTLLCVVKKTGAWAARHILWISDTASSKFIALSCGDNGGSNFLFFANSGTPKTTGNIASADTWYVHAGVSSGGIAEAVYLNGNEYTGNGGNFTVSYDNAIRFGTRPSGPVFFGGEVALALVFNRKLSKTEIASISDNPWQVFKSSNSIWFDSAVGGGAAALAGAESAQANLSSTGLVFQDHQLNSAASTQTNLAGSGVLAQEHWLAGSASTQANAAGSGIVEQAYQLTGASSGQSNTTSSDSVLQAHSLAGATSSQANLASSSVIGQTCILAEVSTTTSNSSATSSITQEHLLVGSTSSQGNETISMALGGVAITLTAAAASQGNTSSTGTIDQAFEINLAGASAAQHNQSAASAILQEHALSVATATQLNTSEALGTITRVQDLSGIACSQANLSASGIIAQFISGAVLAAITFSKLVTRQITFTARPLRSIFFTQEF